MKTDQMITLTDLFNQQVISRHRTLRAAVIAQRRHLAAVQRHNGPNSYLTYSFTRGDGAPVDPTDAQIALDREKYW